MISVVLLLAAFSIDWAKTCKAVNYKYTAFKNKELRGGGCPKGCFGYHNDTDPADNLVASGNEWKTDHWEKSKCVECSKINRDFILTLFYDYLDSIPVTGYTGTVNDTELEKICEGRRNPLTGQANAVVQWTDGVSVGDYPVSLTEDVRGCQWDGKKKKCVETSCPYMAERDKCNGNWTNGKCAKRKGDTCLAYDYVSRLPGIYSRYAIYTSYIWEKYSGTSCSTLLDGTDRFAAIPEEDPHTCADVHGGWVSCNDLDKYYKWVSVNTTYSYKAIKFTADDVKHCNYLCENPQRGFMYPTYDYTIAARKTCNKVYGCLYSDYQAGEGYTQTCSYWAIWAFILFLVLIVLFFIAIIVVIVIIVIKLRGKKTTQVEDGAAAQSKAADSAAPVDSAPPPPSGPYVVIKLGKQEKLTKKVQSSVWGESVIFTGLGAEDDDVEFELHDDSGALLGNVNVRIPEYVNAKKRATLSLKSGEAAIGTLETDIEIQVQEEPEVKITGVFYVDKFIAV